MALNLPDDLEPLPDINIVPMIDVIFAVLAFLIMSSLFLTRSEQLAVNLPEADRAISQLQSQIIISLTPQGQLRVDGMSTTPDDLVDTVSNQVIGLNRQNIRPTLIVSADQDASHGEVVALMDQLQGIEGIGGLAIATQPTEEAEN
ncbi:MAG: biopolymer transporter ExbD [Elainellaceae cyanobacterium]